MGYMANTALSELWGKVKDYADAKVNTWYGTCSTAAATSTKIVTTITGDFSLETGSTLLVKFSYGNESVSTTYLNVDGTGSIRAQAYQYNSSSSYFWQSSEIVEFVYTGSQFEMVEKIPATSEFYGPTKLATSLINNDKLAASASSVYNLANGLVDMIYPVGSIYMSVNNTDPGTLFGGSWQQLEDAFLLGAGSSYSVNHVNDSTPTIDGGEPTHTLTPAETATKNHSHTYAKSNANTNSHTLTVSEIPSHKHNLNERNNSGTSTGWAFMTENGKYAASGTRCVSTGGGDGHTHGIGTTATATTGNPSNADGAAHNNMPPYMVVYIWKRIA